MLPGAARREPEKNIDAAVLEQVRFATEHLAAGRVELAQPLYEAVLQLAPEQPDALHYLGLIAHMQGDSLRAVELISKATVVNGADPYSHCNLGNALLSCNRLDDALASYGRALSIKPDMVQALYNRGNALLDSRRPEEALACFDEALSHDGTLSEAVCNRGRALQDLGRYDDALQAYRSVVQTVPSHAVAHNNMGMVLEKLGRIDDAASSFLDVLRLQPGFIEAHINLGRILQTMRRMDEAATYYRNALQLKPGSAEAHNNLGTVYQEQGRPLEAVGYYLKALECNPRYANAYRNLGAALQELQQFEEAATCYRTVLELDPTDRTAAGMLCNCALSTCDWNAIAEQEASVRARLDAGDAAIMPFHLIGLSSSPQEQYACAKAYLNERLPSLPAALWKGEKYRHDRIRIAYLSADFHAHATAYLMAELLEIHDAGQFEVIGISFGPDDKSAVRGRLIKAFSQFHDVRNLSDEAVARLLRELEVDIAVDLKGFTQGSRIGILAYRPAPLQVSYLGYPGTTGADFIDYVIADPVVLPFDQQVWYSERIVHLPDCYQPNDSRRAVPTRTISRQEFGLPENGFVFCCFNNNYKITREVFSIWMRLLHAVDGSVLWLLEDNTAARRHLLDEAARSGIDPARVMFAPRVDLETHLARHQVADLFLDTLPINAHTTASDSLWAGLPIITCLGETFAGRVAASALHAAGLPELVTSNLERYEALALRLANDAVRLKEIRSSLALNRVACPLFDTRRFKLHLESAYRQMWEKWQHDEPPEQFSVRSIVALN